MIDIARKLPRETQLVLACTLLYLVFSFFDWQQISVFGITVGVSEWHGVGVLAGLLAVAVLLWESCRALDIRLGSAPAAEISASLALALLLFTAITFLTHGEARHWPAWLGLALSAGIAAAAFVRARAEGVQMPARRGPGEGPGSARADSPPGETR